jgi:hypothetical protein
VFFNAPVADAEHRHGQSHRATSARTTVVIVGRFRVVNYRERGRTFPTSAPTEQFGLQIIPGKVRSLTPPRRGSHPQLLIIAHGRGDYVN